MRKLLNNLWLGLLKNSNTCHIQYEISHMVQKKKNNTNDFTVYFASEILPYKYFLITSNFSLSLNLANNMAYVGSIVKKPFCPK